MRLGIWLIIWKFSYVLSYWGKSRILLCLCWIIRLKPRISRDLKLPQRCFLLILYFLQRFLHIHFKLQKWLWTTLLKCHHLFLFLLFLVSIITCNRARTVKHFYFKSGVGTSRRLLILTRLSHEHFLCLPLHRREFFEIRQVRKGSAAAYVDAWRGLVGYRV